MLPEFKKGGLGLGLALASLAGTATAEEVLNIYNWSDYIAEDTIANFEAETGIKVRYDVFDSNEVLEAKLLAGNTGYDLVVPSSSFLARQIQAGVFQPLDRSKLTNYANLDAKAMAKLGAYDPDNAYSIPWMWGTTGVGFNVGMVTERMPDAPVGSWDLLFDPEVVSKFADCGVSLLDSASEVVPVALQYLGKDPTSQDPADLEAVEELLTAIRPYVKYFHSSQYINDLADGEICVAMGWSGDVFIASDRAAEADQGVVVEYYIPEEGTALWFDLMAIPKDAPNVENAHLFLDYVLRPEVVAEITNYVSYANANAASMEFVDEEVRTDPAIYPPPEVMDRLFSSTVYGPKFDRAMNRMWTRVKTGQ